MNAWTKMCFADDLEKSVVIAPGFKERFGTLASHPYNMEKPDQTTWWLFSRTAKGGGNWPAYHLGKYFFDRVSARKVVRAGLHIEKGIAPEAARGYIAGKGLHFGMTPDWAWFGFIEDLRSGAAAEAAAEITRRSGLPVEIAIEPSFPLDQPQPGVHETFGHHRFIVTAGGGLKLEEERPARDKLKGIGKANSILDLAERLTLATKTETWTWINVFVSCAVPYSDQAPAGANAAWNGSDFWTRVMEPLARWVR